jgi:hypothetical protein
MKFAKLAVTVLVVLFVIAAGIYFLAPSSAPQSPSSNQTTAPPVLGLPQILNTADLCSFVPQASILGSGWSIKDECTVSPVDGDSGAISAVNNAFVRRDTTLLRDFLVNFSIQRFSSNVLARAAFDSQKSGSSAAMPNNVECYFDELLDKYTCVKGDIGFTVYGNVSDKVQLVASTIAEKV